MPFSLQCSSALSPDSFVHLEFPTRIVAADDDTAAATVTLLHVAARFKSCVNQRHYLVVLDDDKGHSECLPEDSFGYRFLKRHGFFIEDLETPNRALKTWHAQFSRSPDRGEGPLSRIERDLAKRCPHLKDVLRPLRKLLESPVLQWPVYYAVHNLLTKAKIDADRVLPRLNGPKEGIPEEARRLSFHTVVYCAFQMTPTRTKEDTFLARAGAGWDWIFQTTATVPEMMRHVRWIQEQFFPVVKGSLAGEENLYSWDPLVDRWCRVKEKEEIETVMWFVYRFMTHFEGFFKLPEALLTALENRSEWIDALVENVWNELKDTEPIAFVPLKVSLAKRFGLNVPEYYFASQEVEDVIGGLRNLKLSR